MSNHPKIRESIGNIKLRTSTYEYLEKRAEGCKTNIPHIIEEILECWIAHEKGIIRLNITRMEGENVIEEVSNEEVGDESYSLRLKH